MRASAVNLVGERFGRLLVVEPARSIGPASYVCACDCGQTCIAQAAKLRDGSRRSCGCARALQLAGSRGGTKRCSMCRRTLPRTAFHSLGNVRHPNKLQSKCIECAREYASARHALRRLEREAEPVASPEPVIPPPPPSGTRIADPRTHDRMLPIYLRGPHAYGNEIARTCGVSRRSTCSHYDECLDDVATADDARCPAECPRRDDIGRRIDDFAGFRSAEPVYPNTADEEG